MLCIYRVNGANFDDLISSFYLDFVGTVLALHDPVDKIHGGWS